MTYFQSSIHLLKIPQLDLADMIINLGEIPQSELIGWYSTSDALFFPSYLETFGNPFIEAMSFSLPILAIDLPYARAVCGTAGIYYTKDSVKDAVEKIVILKNDRNFRKIMSKKSAERLKEFPISWEEVAEKYLKILNAISRDFHNKI